MDMTSHAPIVVKKVSWMLSEYFAPALISANSKDAIVALLLSELREYCAYHGIDFDLVVQVSHENSQ